MIEDIHYAIGLMSGTSLDGIDAACCRVERTDIDDPFGYAVSVKSFVEHPYNRETRDRLIHLCDDETGTVDEVCRLNAALAEQFAAAADTVREDAGVATKDVAVVGSHGQTVWHIPNKEILTGTDRCARSTLQIGDGSIIAERTGIPVASDFRVRDIASGGHGAPLVSYFDAANFIDPNVSRAAQNIGGIGNCTLLPANADSNEVTAFDTGPGNMVIDAVVELLTGGERRYDKDGETAAAGTVDDNLVTEYLDDDFFRENPPKTTGREYFGHDYARKFVANARDRGNDDADIVASATSLTARSIAAAYRRFASFQPEEVLVSGGGARNPTLLKMLDEAVPGSVYVTDKFGIDADKKEAALFALLGVTRLDRVPNSVPSATGADEAVVMGKVSLP